MPESDGGGASEPWAGAGADVPDGLDVPEGFDGLDGLELLGGGVVVVVGGGGPMGSSWAWA
jgi:hypothetical protein